jgi:hypothetical protein
MGGIAVRGHTLGISVGNPLSVEPSLDVFNEGAYESIDFAIAAARVYGLKVLTPYLTPFMWLGLIRRPADDTTRRQREFANLHVIFCYSPGHI